MSSQNNALNDLLQNEKKNYGSLYLKEEGVDSRRGIDTDDKSIFIGGKEYGDYEILKQGRVGGSNFLVPHTRSSEVNINKKGDENIFNTMSLDNSLQNINNGRLTDINNVQGNLFSKSQDIVLNKDNHETSIKGILEDTALNTIFFSDTNTDVINKTIRYRVNQMTGKSIDFQSSKEIFIVMRSILLQYGNFRVESQRVVNEIKKLNEQVIKYCSENIASNLKQHMEYINDIGKLPVPLNKPAYENKQNYTYDISNIL